MYFVAVLHNIELFLVAHVIEFKSRFLKNVGMYWFNVDSHRTRAKIGVRQLTDRHRKILNIGDTKAEKPRY